MPLFARNSVLEELVSECNPTKPCSLGKQLLNKDGTNVSSYFLHTVEQTMYEFSSAVYE